MPDAGYSGTPLVKKLGFKAGQHIAFVNAPDDFADTLGPLPEDIAPVAATERALDLAILFTDRAADLTKRFAPLAKRLNPAGMLWVAWPKKASGVPTDLTEDRVRDIGLAAGLVDVKVCAIDAVWSGLKFVYRLRDRTVK